MTQNNLLTSFQNLQLWIEKQNYYGYDPYDIKGLPAVIRLVQKSKTSGLFVPFREILFELFYSFPLFSRKISRIIKTQNAKAVGLISSAYFDLFKISNNQTYLNRAIQGITWLEDHKVVLNDGIGWGYPFDWQSTEFIPAGTPNGIVTTAAGEAFWKKYSLKKNSKDLDTLTKIGVFLTGLPIDKISDDKLCFSYTPLFQNHIHNLNLFIAEFLLKVGLEKNNREWQDLAHAAVSYTLNDQHPEGSFDYNGPPEPPARYIDHYHTGFVLRMLFSIWKLTGRDDVYDALKKGYSFYEKKLFKDGIIPKLKPDRTYRIDIHSCAEAVNCLCSLSELFPEAKDKAEKVLLWTIRELQDKKGYFYYGILKSRFTGIRYKSKIPYFRWGQAWMLKAFASYLSISPDIKAETKC